MEESEMTKYSKIGKICDDFDLVQLKSVLIKNDAGDWGNEPDNNAIGIIRSTNFNNDGKLDLTNVAYRTLSVRKLEEKKLSVSDILIERSGGSETQPVGRVGYITEEIAKNDFAFANFIQRISIDDTIDSKFIYYCLQHLYEMGITSGMQTQTTGIRNLDWKQYIGTYLPKPSLPEQASIANILSKVDEAIESVKKSIEAAEKLKKSLMQNLLTGRMKPDCTLRTEEEFYEDEKFGKVPIGWEVKKVKNCFKFKNGKGNTTSNLKEIPDDEYCVPVYGGNGITGYYHSALLNKPTIIIGRVGEYCGNVFKTPEESWVTDNAMLVSEVLMQDYNIDFFTIKLNSLNFKQYSDSTGQPKITQGSIGGIFITYPVKIEEQNKIIYLIDNISNNIQQKQTQITTLERLKKSLMQNLLTGKVRVKK